MKIENLDDLFLAEIEDLYDCEKRLTKALPKMAKASTSPELRKAFETHLEETQGHVERLERVFNEIGKKPKAVPCEAITGLIEEGEEMIGNTEQSPVRDAGIIAAANRVEHYEIAAYGAARTFAETLGLSSAVSLLDQTLEEEKKADQKLTKIAETKVNQDAMRAAPVHQR